MVRKVPSGRGSRTTQFPVKSAAKHGAASSTSKTVQRDFIPVGDYNNRTSAQNVLCAVNGVIAVDAEPELVACFGSLERWDGKRGPGNLNAHRCMDRAIALSREHGIGCVALANTNHWMRGGNYGWQAGDAGVIGICWTNTMANLPPWGASDPRVGNNPLIIAVPRAKSHVVLDMAMSQFSYGTLASYRMRGEPLPVEGLRRSGKAHARSCGHRSIEAPAAHRLLEGLRFGVAAGYGRSAAIRRLRHPSDTGRHRTRNGSLASVHRHGPNFHRPNQCFREPSRPDCGGSAITPACGW